MKKVKINIPETPAYRRFINFLRAETQGTNTLGYKYVFDEDERKSLEESLQRIKDIDQEKKNLFIESAEYYCSQRNIIQTTRKILERKREEF